MRYLKDWQINLERLLVHYKKYIKKSLFNIYFFLNIFYKFNSTCTIRVEYKFMNQEYEDYENYDDY